MFNNWLLNMKGREGAFLEGDLFQEHSNKLLEELVTKYSGRWDKSFYREIISPNIYHLLTICSEVELAFQLSPRSQKHTSPSLSKELQSLLTLYKDEELHKFVSG